MSSDDETKPKKRQRMSVVCLNCKARKIKCDKKRPACTNCVKCNVGHLCRYEAPHWVNRVINAEGKAKVESRQEPELLPTNIQTPNGGNEKALQDEIRKLRSRLESIEGALLYTKSAPNVARVGIKREYEDDTIDFYGTYNSLTIKRSCMEDHKPLCSAAIVKKDHYLSLVFGYFFLCTVLRKASRVKGAPRKKKQIDSSLSMCLELLGENESPFLTEIISKFAQERFHSDDPRSLLFPLSSLTNISKPLYINELKCEIEKMLPAKSIIKLYLDRFFKYIYPFFPVVGEGFYRERMLNLVLKSQSDESSIELHIEDKFDFAFVATLLIFLRFAYVSIGIPTTEADSKLLENPISPHFITAAQTALSQFKLMRKTKLHIVQALYYLRSYLNFAPEDGDGQELNQSQILLGTLIQSAFSMGMNRDAENYSHLNKDYRYINLWRKMWISILEMDRVGAVLSGQSCVIQNINSYEMKFPQLREEETIREHAIVDEMRREQRLYLLYLDLSNEVNNMGPPTKVADVLSTVKQMYTYVTLNYSLNNIIQLDKDNEDVANYQNSRALKHNLIIRSLSLLIYQSLALNYESKEHYDLAKYQHFQSLVIETAVELSDVLTKYLGDDYNNFIDPNYHFYLNRIVENATTRVTNAFIAILSRLYHTKDLLIKAFNTSDTAIIRSINDLTSLVFRITNAINTLLQKKLGKDHYPAFKTSLMNKFFLRSLKKDGFKCINDTINFLADTTNSSTQDEVKPQMIEKMEYEQGFSREVLKNLNNMNAFIDYSVQDFKNLFKIAEVAYILKDEELSSERALWGPSFAADLGTNNLDIRNLGQMNNSGVGNSNTNNSVLQGFHIGNNNNLLSTNPPPNAASGIDSSMGLVNLDQILSGDVLDFESLKYEINVENMFRLG